MNDRIWDLIEQADNEGGDDPDIRDALLVKLIVKECITALWTDECVYSDLALEEFEKNSAKIELHFGVEE